MSDATDPQHHRPAGVDDLTVDALGKISVAVASERHVREVVMDGRQHIQEAERKVRRRQDGPTDDED